MKIIYFIRHSKPIDVNNDFNDESLQEKNEKRVLSVEVEQIAFNWFNNDKFNNIKEVYSSNYVRAIGTAKYLAKKYAKNIGLPFKSFNLEESRKKVNGKCK